MAARLDDVDRRVVAALHLRPRASFDELGGVLHLDASTVARRWGRLVDEGWVRVVGQVDWAMYSTALPVHLVVDTHGVAPQEVAAALGRIGAVQYLARTTGRSPVFATVHAASEEETARVLDDVYALPGVAAVRTVPVLEVHGRGAGWDPGLLGPQERARCRALDEGQGADPGSTGTGPASTAEREVVELLRHDGRASAAAVGRTTGMAASTAHRVVRRVLDRGWVRPRVEVDPGLLGFGTPFVLQLTTRPGEVAAALEQLTSLPETRFTTRVAGRASLLCTGLVTDRPALARFLDQHVAGLDGVQEVEVDIVLTEHRRYWLDRGPDGVLGRYAPPPLL